MSWEDQPDRLFALLGEQAVPAEEHTFDLVSLIVTERHATAGLEPEEAAILTRCTAPTSVAELAALLELPLGVVCVLLSRLADRGAITARHPTTAPQTTAASRPGFAAPDIAELERVLDALQKL